MLVTLFSDASICSNTGIAAWASWAKCDRGTARGDGAFRRVTNDSTVAEAMAAVNGIVVADRASLIHEGDTILIQTDNNTVMQVLLGTARRGFRDKDAPGPGFKEMRGIKRRLSMELECLEASANDDALRIVRIEELQAEIAGVRQQIKARDRLIANLTRVADRRNEEIREIARIYDTLVERLGVTIRWRHCKGHKGQESKRSSVNDDCDKRARKRMQEARRDYHREQANLSKPLTDDLPAEAVRSLPLAA